MTKKTRASSMTAIYRHDLITYVYCSHATPAMTKAEIPRIIQSAEKNNSELEITGILTYGGGMFMQWLEGPHHSVHELMGWLRKDPRHECILQLHSMSGLQNRLYPGWSMALVEPQDIQEVLEQAIQKTDSPKHVEAITMMLQLFDDGALRPIVL
jgi:hypothetical protein